MNLLNNYLVELNDYPKFKKNRAKKFLESNISKMLIISFALLTIKIGAEYLVEWLLNIH
jgi:hypothetical protein